MSDSPFIRRMDHLVVTVSDLKASLHFYQSMLGLKLLNVNGDHTVATLRAGDQLLRLQTGDRPCACHRAAENRCHSGLWNSRRQAPLSLIHI